MDASRVLLTVFTSLFHSQFSFIECFQANFHQFHINRKLSLISYVLTSSSSSSMLTHLCYSLMLLFIHLCMMRLEQRNYSFFQSSDIRYHINRHYWILMTTINVILHCIAGKHHPLYRLQCPESSFSCHFHTNKF